MATLSADKSRKYHITADDRTGLIPAVAADTIYQGAAVSDNGSGVGQPLSTGEVFVGFANAKADNSAGVASAIGIDLRVTGEIELAVTGASSTADVSETVYATDDDTFTLTSSGASSIGKVSRWITGTTCVVRFEGAAQRSI